jgi:hypothetical protein
MKTLDEVRAAFNAEGGDMFGFGKEVLGTYLPENYEDKDKIPDFEEEVVRNDMLDYLDFAFGKALDHRGLSAGRSVIKLAKWAWILDRQDLVDFAEDESNYANYGVPVLKRFAQAFDVKMPDSIIAWEDGEACEPGCSMGCGR